MQKQNWLFGARHAFHKSFKAKSQRAIRLRFCESISLIFAPFYVNSSHQNRFKCCNLNGLNFSLIIIESLLLRNVGFIVRFYCFMFTEISFYTNWWSSLKQNKLIKNKRTITHDIYIYTFIYKWIYERSFFWTAEKDDVKTWLIIPVICNSSSCGIKAWKKIYAWTGFEPLTSAILV